MRALILFSILATSAFAFAQGSAAPSTDASGAGSAAPTGTTGAADASGAGSAAPAGTTGAGSGAGSAAASGAGGSANAPAADPAPAPNAPAPDLAARRAICEGAWKAPPGGDTRFLGETQAFARGLVAAPQLKKSPEGQACIDAIIGIDDFRSTASMAADTDAATKLAAEVELQHENAAKAIAKNEKHVVLAYAALWVLAAGFLLFLWRRQQALKTEIANLKRDLEAATK